MTLRYLMPIFLLCSASAVQAQKAEVFGDPAKQIETIGGVKAPQRVVVIPTVQVKWMVYGKVSKTASPHMFQQNTRAARSTTEVIGSVEPAALKALADGLHTDLVAQFRAAGWQVVTAADLGADTPSWSVMDTDPTTGLAEDKFTRDAERRYAIASATGMPIFKTVAGGKFLAPGNNIGISKLARDRNALVVVPTYIFDTAELDQSTRQGFNNVQASTSATAALQLAGSAAISAPRGMLTMTIKSPITVAEDVGELREISGKGDSAFTSTMRFLGGLAKVSKAAFTLVPDEARLKSEAERAGGAFNAQIVARLNR